MKITLAIILTLAFLPLIVLAHEGHGSTEGYTLTHYIFEPLHALITILVSVLAIFIFMRRTRRARE
ncbi:hypothetical protein OCK74_08455 [Chitinophagaceae bacterium LB-8]|uniref:Uncharacterized protein n=1 Tax=Paraflavisolibacter caeni TaxID=2982496 RepID=A0A9X3BFL4_9BACT|nr:hypothetical protein [Paraflavisolibacter caeni]MCU7549144.1 hypothetical protein [Paraflavisolibacter caeni]